MQRFRVRSHGHQWDVTTIEIGLEVQEWIQLNDTSRNQGAHFEAVCYS